jgi:hypothetical protein
MDSNADAVIQAVFHLVLVAVLHCRRSPTGITSRRNAKTPRDGNPIRPRVQITRPLKP